MPTISIQFHALLNELGAFMRQWVQVHSLFTTAIDFPPFSASPLLESDIDEALARSTLIKAIFTLEAVRLPVKTEGELLDRHPNALLLSIGRQTPRGLEESHLSSMSALDPWKAMVRDLKRSTTAGAIAVNDETGATARSAAHRFTLGARTLALSGVALRQFAQSRVRLRPADI